MAHTRQQPIPLGAFELIEPIGRGGMGEVWRGRHVARQVEVAVKVITASRARRQHYLRAFRNEVRAVARLDHPGIVDVFDYGEVSHQAEALSGGRLAAGSPYLVMELARRGSLDRAGHPRGWAELRYVLMSLLDALAHAHARGVIHRDIKPSNVLVFAGSADEALEAGGALVKLTDFGIAHAAEPSTDSGLLSRGTPHYMAPEQVAGQWRDHGPWTDLYALGCLVYQLVEGHPPFWEKGIDSMELLRRQLRVTPPPLERPIVPIPDGFHGWVTRLLAKRPQNRFRRAADAARALMALPLPPTEIPGTAPLPVPPFVSPATDRVTLGLTTGVGPTPTTDPPKLPGIRPEERPVLARVPRKREKPPALPPSWRRPHETRPSVRLAGVGLGLYALRPVPLVDRVTERDSIWKALHEVHRVGRPRLVVLHGGAGNGKTRLAEWMCERAHEVGGAIVVSSVHSPIPGPADGLAGMLTSYLGCQGLSPRDRLERLQARLADDPGGLEDARALTALMGSEAPDGRAVRYRFASPEDRFNAIRRLLLRLVYERPVILWHDDAQWGADAIGLTRYLMEQNGDYLPILNLLTVNEDALRERPIEAAMLDELRRARPERSHFQPVGPLDKADAAELVQGLLGLDHGLASEVEERAAGNPLFAVQLVGDWVQRDLLEAGDRGFVLKKDAEHALPDDIHQLWSRRLERLAARVGGDQALESLELAAALGQDVDAAEWALAAEAAGRELPAGLLDAMVSWRLAVSTKHGWSFAHGMLRESLERRAREAGRWQAHHEACATMMEDRYPLRGGGVAERLAQHLFDAEAWEEALEPLLIAAEARRVTGDFPQAYALYDRRDRALEALDAPEHDRRWVEGWIHRARTQVKHGLLEDGLALVERSAELAEAAGWREALGEIYWLEGLIAQGRGDNKLARVALEKARALAEETGDRLSMRRALSALGALAKATGDLERAAGQAQAALMLAEADNDLDAAADCMMLLGDVLGRLGDVERGTAMVRQGLRHHERVGDRFSIAWCHNALGDLARAQGNLEDAEHHYRRALRVRESMRSPYTEVTRVNLSLVLIERGEFEAARRMMQGTRAVLEATGREGFLSFVNAQLLACAAARRDWRDFDTLVDSVAQQLEATPMVDDDLARPLALAGDLAWERDQPDRARRAYEMAVRQWRTMGKKALAATVEARLGALESGEGPG